MKIQVWEVHARHEVDGVAGVTSIGDLKLRLQRDHYYPTDEQILLFHGHVLADEATLAEAGVSSSDPVIHLVFRLPQYFARVYTPPPPPKFESATSAQLFGGDDGIGDGSDSDDDPWSSTAGDTYAAFKAGLIPDRFSRVVFLEGVSDFSLIKDVISALRRDSSLAVRDGNFHVFLPSADPSQPPRALKPEDDISTVGAGPSAEFIVWAYADDDVIRVPIPRLLCLAPSGKETALKGRVFWTSTVETIMDVVRKDEFVSQRDQAFSFVDPRDGTEVSIADPAHPVFTLGVTEVIVTVPRDAIPPVVADVSSEPVGTGAATSADARGAAGGDVGATSQAAAEIGSTDEGGPGPAGGDVIDATAAVLGSGDGSSPTVGVTDEPAGVGATEANADAPPPPPPPPSLEAVSVLTGARHVLEGVHAGHTADTLRFHIAPVLDVTVDRVMVWVDTRPADATMVLSNESVVQFLVVHPDGLVAGAAEVGAQGTENNSAPESLPLAAGQAGDDQAGPAGPAPRLPRGSGAAAAARDAIGAMEAELAACEAEIADRDALVVTLLDALAKRDAALAVAAEREVLLAKVDDERVRLRRRLGLGNRPF